MMAPREAAFVVNLLQDVNILRGLAYLIHREIGAEIHFLLTAGFLKRDTHKIWQKEIAAIARDVQALIHVIKTPGDTQAALQGRGGVIVSASESDLGPHRETAAILRAAPASFVSVTLQHGLECVGFRQSREHVVAHGRDVGFNADVVCAWLAPQQLTATRVSERGKIVVTGPSTLLQRPRAHPEHPALTGSFVCENMHSVRLAATGDHKASFMDIFAAFCARMQEAGKSVTLRPHPGGQYMLKNKVPLADNVLLNNLPIYDVNLKGYGFGISAPSTVVFDMVLAGLPVGVWGDGDGIMDLGNYAGLTAISSLEDWLAFEQEATRNPGAILTRQAGYLDRLDILTDPGEIYRRFARLFANLLGQRSAAKPPRPDPLPERANAWQPKRVQFFSNGVIPTLQLSFLKPLAERVESKQMKHEIVTEADMKELFGKKTAQAEARKWVTQRILDFAPDLIVCCRYSGPHSDAILEGAGKLDVPVIYHVDDDLTNIPLEIGKAKHAFHNQPARLESVNRLLRGSTAVYCSTAALKRRLRQQQVETPIYNGEVYCTSRLLRAAEPGETRRIGYMGFDHAHDFETALPGLLAYMARNPAVEFELFGSIPMPKELKVFGARVRSIPPVRNYAEFLQTLAERKWDIGICPLAHTPFNAVKANTKWVEYTACGMATIATKGTIYDDCAGEGRGLLVSEDEWQDALETLTADPVLRYHMAIQAQSHLLLNYAEATLTEQVLRVFALARTLKDTPAHIRDVTAGRISPVRPNAKGLIPL